MTLPLNQVGAAIAAWIDAELAPKATGLQKLATVMAGLALAKRGEALMAQYAPTLDMLGITDSGGGIDLDAARNLAQEAFARVGNVTAFGVVFDAGDVETAYKIAQKFST